MLIVGEGGEEFEGLRRALEKERCALLRVADVARVERGEKDSDSFRLLPQLRLRHPDLPVVFGSARPRWGSWPRRPSGGA
ncbi:MAG: hypothetical protein ACE5JJ_00310 [Nitrospinota bacterium]